MNLDSLDRRLKDLERCSPKMFYDIIGNNIKSVIESNHESRFAPKTMKTIAGDCSIDMGSEGC